MQKTTDKPSNHLTLDTVQEEKPKKLSEKEKNQKLKSHFQLVQKAIVAMNVYERMLRMHKNACDRLSSFEDWNTIQDAADRLVKKIKSTKF